jgi:iron-sulfur cluster assembly accessory protein
MVLLKIKRKQKENLVTDHTHDIKPVAHNQLGITPEACEYINNYIKNNLSVKGIRICIKGGGCSGLSIHYEWCETIKPTDLVFEADSAKLIIDPKSLSVIGGSSLHCQSYLDSRAFTLLNNPNAKQCSCGQSFSL